MSIARAQRARNYSRRLVQSFTLFVLLLGMALIMPAGTGHSAQVSLAWNANTEQNIAGYKIYYGTASHDYDWVLNVGKVTTSTVTGLTDGLTYYFAATAYNTSNLESAYSGEVSTSTCTYSISPSSQSFTASGGTGTVSVSTQSTCPWTAGSGASWMTITSGSNGTGNGTVRYSMSANTSPSSRTASSTMAGKVFTVTQAGTSGSAFTITASAGTGGSISPSGAVSVSYGASRTFTITPNSGYRVAGVLVDGSSVGAVTTYSFSNVTTNHTIAASFAANTNAEEALVVEAEDATLRTAGGAIPDGWCLFSNGTLGEKVSIPAAGTYKVVVRAYGSPLGGVWPVMALTVDGVAGGTTTVGTSVYTDYSFQLALAPGDHLIGVSFLNDANNPGVEDRNLYLDRVVIISPPGIARPQLASGLVIEAEDASLRTAGEAIPDGWCLNSNGTLGEKVSIPAAGTYKVVIRAYGRPLGGVWPVMALTVDGVAGETTTVNTSVYTDYSFQVALAPGDHLIGVTFLNDAYNPGLEDRNLYLDRLVIISPPGIARPQLASGLVIEAEDATLRTAGEAIPDGWCLNSNGTLGEKVSIPAAGTYKVVVRAYGSPLGGVWPVMALTVDGVAGETTTVDTSVYTDYSFQVALAPGDHLIGVSFLNDAYNPGLEDRNLYLDRLMIISPPGLAKPEIASQ